MKPSACLLDEWRMFYDNWRQTQLSKNKPRHFQNGRTHMGRAILDGLSHSEFIKGLIVIFSACPESGVVCSCTALGAEQRPN